MCIIAIHQFILLSLCVWAFNLHSVVIIQVMAYQKVSTRDLSRDVLNKTPQKSGQDHITNPKQYENWDELTPLLIRSTISSMPSSLTPQSIPTMTLLLDEDWANNLPSSATLKKQRKKRKNAKNNPDKQNQSTTQSTTATIIKYDDQNTNQKPFTTLNLPTATLHQHRSAPLVKSHHSASTPAIPLPPLLSDHPQQLKALRRSHRVFSSDYESGVVVGDERTQNDVGLNDNDNKNNNNNNNLRETDGYTPSNLFSTFQFASGNTRSNGSSLYTPPTELVKVAMPLKPILRNDVHQFNVAFRGVYRQI